VIVLAFRFYLPSLSAVGEQRRGSHEEERQTDEAIVSRKKCPSFILLVDHPVFIP
jgi:hypothetical protein